MQRRALLAGLAGSAAALAGCTIGSPSADSLQVYNPTGHATARPLDEPLLRNGLTSDAGQYLYGRLFQPGDSIAVTDTERAGQFETTIESLSETQFAVLTNLRTAAVAPAYLWPDDTDATAQRLRLDLERRTVSTDGGVESASGEVVGVALAVFDYDGDDLPDSIELHLQSGAILGMRSG